MSLAGCRTATLGCLCAWSAGRADAALVLRGCAVKYAAFLRKRTNTNPKFGPIHYRSPAKILWRTIRGMLPHKTAKGQAALGRLKVFEGIPAPYDKVGPQPGPRGLFAWEGGGACATAGCLCAEARPPNSFAARCRRCRR